MTNQTNFNLSQIETFTTPHEFKTKFPISNEQAAFITDSRRTIKEIISGFDPRLLVIVGPCSIHDIASAEEYAEKLQALANTVSDEIFLTMRVYLEKPRTSIGWKGLVYDPHLDNSNDMQTGLKNARELLLKLATLQVPAAAEFLDLASIYYLNDLISWGCIGARTTSSQFHRQIASGLMMPIGFKNNTDGNISIAIDGISVSSTAHTFIGMSEKGLPSLFHTNGNPDCHLVLRGGYKRTNFDAASISNAIELLKKSYTNPNLIIDCSHDNSMKEHLKQVEVFRSVMTQRAKGNTAIKGMLLESHLNSGKQALSQNLKYGVSITDSCLDWESTKMLILSAYDQCKKVNFALSS